MASIYEFTDYRDYLKNWIQGQSPQKKGLQGQLAKSLNISSTMISLILKGSKQLNLEQASDLSDFLGLTDRESEYFFLLVELGRSGSFKLEKKLRKRIKEHQDLAKKISRRAKNDIELNDEIKAIYYSSWIYTGLRNLTALPNKNEIQYFSQRLGLPQNVVARAIEFLVQNGLCQYQNSRLTYRQAHTHLDSDSPFVIKHHQNWRLKGFSVMDQFDQNHLFYTCPMSLSEKVAEEVRRLLPQVIEDILKKTNPSPSEKVYCLNLDWFEY